jgi:hypothetical protein
MTATFTRVVKKRTTETWKCPFNFISRLAVGETISAATFTIEVHSGVDPNPSVMLVGGGSSPTIDGPTVVNLIQGGVDGVTYCVRAQVTTSQGGVWDGVATLEVDDAC